MEIYRMSKVPSEFNALQIVVLDLIEEKGESDWGMTAQEVADIVAYRTKWTLLYNEAKEEMTMNKTTTQNRNENQLLYLPALVIVFNKFLINNTAISATDKVAMGIHEMVVSKTRLSVPNQAPRVEITYGAPLQHIVNMVNAATNRRGKPKGVGFMEMWYKIGKPAPAGLPDANLKVNIHISGEAITYLLDQKGMTVYFFARWVTKKGGYGPWGAFFSAVIA